MEAIKQAYNGLFIICIIVVALLIFLCLCRAIKGPRVADRIVSANMIGTMTIIIIAILSVLLEESYLLDVCLIYAMISFLAVVVLTKVYQGVYIERIEKRKALSKEEELHEAILKMSHGEPEEKDEVQAVKEEGTSC